MKKFIFFIILFLFLDRAVIAGTKFGTLLTVVHQNGTGGRQVFDGSQTESMKVFEPLAFFETQIDKDTKLSANFLFDVWSSASEGIFDTYTGASARPLGEKVLQHRFAFDVSAELKRGSWIISPEIGISKEYDYSSANVGFNVSRLFADDCFVLSLGYRYFHDQVYDYSVAQRQFTTWQNKNTHTIDLSASQILSQSDLILLGYSFTYQNGLLDSVVNSVNLLGLRTDEVLPDQRQRHALTTRYIHGFNDWLALHLDYRFYMDNWGLRAHTAEPALYFSIDQDQGYAGIFYRYHRQNAVDYYADQFSTALTYMTSDSDLEAFTSHEVGFRTQYSFTGHQKLSSLHLGLSAFYYVRTNDLHALITQASLQFDFH